MEQSRSIDGTLAGGQAALIITYHDIGRGRPPLCIPVELLQAHVDYLAECGATPMTISALAWSLSENRLPPRPVCLTFDDAFTSVVDAAAPVLLERGFPATIFAVAGYLGKTNDWPSQPAFVERRPLARADALAELAQAGFEIGAHGVDHEPLRRLTPEATKREVVDGKARLEDAVGVSIESFAYPYGSLPRRPGRAIVTRTYAAACTTDPALVRPGRDPAALPRVDAHYLRRPDLPRRLLEGSGSARAYLGARRVARRIRRFGPGGR